MCFFHLMPAQGIGDIHVPSPIHITPNPARESARISVDGIVGKATGTLLTTLGKTLRDFTFPGSENGTTSCNLDLSGLTKGIYLVRVNSSSFTHIEKLVIE